MKMYNLGMVIYGELLFLENLIIGGVLLYITGMIHGKSAGTAKARLRLLAGSLMCGVFSLVIFLDAKGQLLLLMEVVFAAAVCMVTFGRSCAGDNADGSNGKARGKPLSRALWQIPWQYTLTFILVTYFMGGMTMGLLLVTDNTGIYTAAGIYTGDLKAGMLAVFVGISCITIKQVIKTIKARKFYSEHVFSAVIVIGENHIETRAFLDTGNSLQEPVTGRPVAVAVTELWKNLENSSTMTENRFCIIPYETVGGRGLLSGVRTDYINVNGRQIRDAVIAKGDGVFSVNKGADMTYELLLSKGMIEGRL